MKNEIAISPFGNMLVYKKGYTPKFVKNAIVQHKLEGLRIFDHLDRLESLDFLREYSFLEKLDIDCLYDHDYSFLQTLINLKYLGIGIATKESNVIDLSNQINLVSLAIQWRKKIVGLENCIGLTSLTVVAFKERDLTKLANLTSLIDLRVKTGAIESLEGINSLVNLQSLQLANCKKLTSVKSMNHLLKVHHLEFDTCPNIKDYDQLTSLPSLQIFSMINCGKIESIKFIENYPLLSKLSLLGNTIINDGNLLPAKRLSSVEHRHYDHYNIKLEDKVYEQTVKDNLQRIKNMIKK